MKTLARSVIEVPLSADSFTYPNTHEIESTFSRGRCRFILECTCGAHHDTPFIDEALNWWDSHRLQTKLISFT